MIEVLVIAGPTATGKTKLSLELARLFDGEIINGDAMQFYQGLDIGTAKIKKEEQKGIRHHLLDILDPTANFSVAEYQKMVRIKISEIKSRRKLPIIVGGSGLYLSSVIYDYKFYGNERDKAKEHTLSDYSTEELAEILRNEKPELAKRTDLENRRRVLRALEKKETDLQDQLLPYYKFAYVVGLEMPREILYQRIDNRVDFMIQSGLIEEVKALYLSKVNSQSIKAIGYKELYRMFDGEFDLPTAIDLIKRNSRRYAKRQMTWFRNKMNCEWFRVDPENFNKTINEVSEIIKKKLN